MREKSRIQYKKILEIKGNPINSMKLVPLASNLTKTSAALFPV